ncbi:MAG: bifunctional metallophosphatase/5'-nucleotidase, partial [Prevotella sp.]|nr:bifunctional metallophosphatase/5'-nucleotidase [Prevotella sp.]
MSRHSVIKILYTTDIHGSFFPYDFIERKPCTGSLARAASYIKAQRARYGKRLLLLDGGDVLQGQPTCYYSNFVAPEQPNMAARVLNELGYDAQAIGNHDIETGHAVYDKYIREANYAVLAANIVDARTGEPYFKPYALFVVDGVRIAVIGMVTAAIPYWLHESLWQGMQFQSIASCLQRWVNHVRSNEQADFVVGLFHSGYTGGIADTRYPENEVKVVAQQTMGIDIILFGHDHQQKQEVVGHADGSSTLLLNPSSNAHLMAELTLNLKITSEEVQKIDCKGELVSLEKQPIDDVFMQHFAADKQQVEDYTQQIVGRTTYALRTRDSFFCSSRFSDFIHDVQLSVAPATLSFNAPLKFDAVIAPGYIYVYDLFNLYTYENQLYVLRLTGQEIKQYLEYSYALWTQTMHNPADHLMRMEQGSDGHWSWQNLAFNFDTVAGIDYEVDVRLPIGQKINILRLSNGAPFMLNQSYRVAMNSYRGNGGGELLTRGAGIPFEELPQRILWV